MAEPPPIATGPPFGEVLANLRDQEGNLIELLGIVLEMLDNCRTRKHLGPADFSNMPPAPTVIQQTLWLPWLGGSGTYMISGLFGSGQGGNYTPQSGDGD